MTSRPLIDPSQIDDIIRRAKADQAQYVLNKIESGVGRARLGGVVTLVAACLAVFVTHVNSNGQHGSTGQNTNRSY